MLNRLNDLFGYIRQSTMVSNVSISLNCYSMPLSICTMMNYVGGGSTCLSKCSYCMTFSDIIVVVLYTESELFLCTWPHVKIVWQRDYNILRFSA